MSTEIHPLPLTSGRRLARNTLWNLLGTGAPALVALLAIPILIRGIGVPRFGVLTLAWMVIGYFGLFDLGLGTTLTRMVADRLGAGKESEIPPLVWTALALMLVLGILGSVVLLVLSPVLVHRILKIPADLQSETLQSFYLLAVSLPIIITTTGLRGLLEAQQLFRAVNAIRIPMGVFTFLGPLMVLPFSRRLAPVIAVLALARIMTWALYLVQCLKSLPDLRQKFVLRRRLVSQVIRFGSWMTVSNLISPVLVYMDRLLIGSLVSVAAVAYYATPFEVVSKLLILPAAIGGVLFPAFAVSFAQDRGRMALLLLRGLKYIFLIVFPAVLALVAMAHEGLRLWLGSDFAQNSTLVLRWLAVGVFINCLGQLPFAMIQGAGRPDLTAKLHLIELPLYLVTLWFMVKLYGIQGAAIAWTGRVSLDTTLLLLMARRFLPGNDPFLRRFGAAAGAALPVLFLAAVPATIYGRAGFLATVLVVLFASVWLFFLAPEERRWLRVMAEPVRRGLQKPEAV